VIWRHRLSLSVVRGVGSPLAHDADDGAHDGAHDGAEGGRPSSGSMHDWVGPKGMLLASVAPGFTPARVDPHLCQVPILHDALIHRAPLPSTVYSRIHINN